MEETSFGRYRLLSLIGEGGMGQVYKAHDAMMDRDVAIKVLPPELAAEPGYENGSGVEAHTAARLTEPHIVPIYEAGEIDGRLYLVMPVIERHRRHRLQRDGPMSPQRAVHMIEQLAAALDAAHAVGLVHRDVKPSNALVTGRDFVYLIDFGIAHDVAATKLTQNRRDRRHPGLHGPRALHHRHRDARSDVYALACVLYECLTGAQPYPGDSMEQQVAGHLTLDPPRPSARRPDLPVGFDEVIARGMAKDPDQRYQSARELATAARRALTEVPTPTHNPHTGPALLADPTRPAPGPTLGGDRVPPPPTPGPRQGTTTTACRPDPGRDPASPAASKACQDPTGDPTRQAGCADQDRSGRPRGGLSRTQRQDQVRGLDGLQGIQDPGPHRNRFHRAGRHARPGRGLAVLRPGRTTDLDCRLAVCASSKTPAPQPDS